MIKRTDSIARTLILALLLVASAATNCVAASFTLVIDAGHGGHDAGARGNFSNEKDINLKVALAFGRYVEKNCPDVRVIYTRKTDVFIPLHKRADIANKNKADVFMSIHTNALPGGKIARGMETYTMGMRRSDEKLSAAMRENAVITYESDYKQRYEGYDPNSPESAIMFEFIHDKNMAKSVELAKLVQKYTCDMASRPNKGVRQDVFLVLRETSMPACLIELGFITTPDEERLLNDETTVDNMARGIYNAFAHYKNDNSTGFTVPYEATNSTKPKIPSIVPRDDTKDDSKTRKQTAAKPSRPASAATGSEAQQKSSDDRKDTISKSPAVSSARPNTAAEQTQKQVSQSAKAARESGKPLFKVQILASNAVLSANSARLKGQTGAEYYREGGMVKYTVGSSTDYNEINKLRRTLAEKFPDCFIVAFRDGAKMNINEAIRLFRSNGK